jgi:hypothetical protein
VAKKAAQQKIVLTCTGAAGGTCEPVGSFVRDGEAATVAVGVRSSVTAGGKAGCSNAATGTTITRPVGPKKQKLSKSGQRKFKIKLNPIGSCLVKLAGDKGILVDLSTTIRPQNGEERLLKQLVRVVRKQ